MNGRAARRGQIAMALVVGTAGTALVALYARTAAPRRRRAQRCSATSWCWCR
jgi:hypothetical protein